MTCQCGHQQDEHVGPDGDFTGRECYGSLGWNAGSRVCPCLGFARVTPAQAGPRAQDRCPRPGCGHRFDAHDAKGPCDVRYPDRTHCVCYRCGCWTPEIK